MTAERTPRRARGRADAPNPKHVNRLALDRREAAAALGVSVDSFEAHVLPTLRVVRVGRRVVVPVSELSRWLDRHASVAGEAVSRSC